MKFFYLIAAFVLLAVQIAAAVPAEHRLCQIYCPDIESPVCAKRGSTTKKFSSACRLNAANMCEEGESELVFIFPYSEYVYCLFFFRMDQGILLSAFLIPILRLNKLLLA